MRSDSWSASSAAVYAHIRVRIAQLDLALEAIRIGVGRTDVRLGFQGMSLSFGGEIRGSATSAPPGLPCALDRHRCDLSGPTQHARAIVRRRRLVQLARDGRSSSDRVEEERTVAPRAEAPPRHEVDSSGEHDHQTRSGDGGQIRVLTADQNKDPRWRPVLGRARRSANITFVRNPISARTRVLPAVCLNFGRALSSNASLPSCGRHIAGVRPMRTMTTPAFVPTSPTAA